MRSVESILIHIISGTILIVFLSGCAVKKTPYFQTSYYKNTVCQLDSIKPEISFTRDSIYAGFSKVSITPVINNPGMPGNNDNKIPIAGYGQRKTKYATGIHDSIFIKTLALKVGEQTVFIISAHLLIMPTNIIDSVTAALFKIGIQRNSLFFSATHTHSGIGGWGYGLLAKLIAGKEDKYIEEFLITNIVKSVLDAKADLHPSKLGYGNFSGESYIHNRLTGDQQNNLNDFNYFLVEQNGRRKAVLGSFSAHPTTIGRKNTLISGDYPGYWERKIESEGFYMGMFCAGSMGGQSPVGEGVEFDNAKFIGEALADSLSSHLKKVNLAEKLTMSAFSLKISLPEYHIRLTKNMNLSSGLSRMIMPMPQNVYLQALQINNLLWFFTPGDFSGELALTVKKLLAGQGYQTMVSGYNGSYIGYIIPGKYFYLNHYESRSMGWFGPTMGDYMMELIDRMANDIISENK